MPKVLSVKGFEFFFYSNEGIEPCHIHVVRAEAIAKVWLEPETDIAYAYGFSPSEKKAFMLIIADNIETIKKSWDEHFNK
jgi:hypothetical protein